MSRVRARFMVDTVARVGPGYWESGQNLTSGETQSFRFTAAWEHGGSSSEQPDVWGPAWLCDYPGGRTLRLRSQD